MEGRPPSATRTSYPPRSREVSPDDATKSSYSISQGMAKAGEEGFGYWSYLEKLGSLASVRLIAYFNAGCAISSFSSSWRVLSAFSPFVARARYPN